MPERVRVQKELAEEILGHSIHWVYDLARPEGAQAALDEADARYQAVVETVNWSRIALEAYSRCLKSNHGSAEEAWMDYRPVPCGICIKAELLVSTSIERGGRNVGFL